jgi:hypothetical protein
MFVETIVLPRPEWERWEERLRYSTDPPKALIATIVWDSGDGQVTGVNVWDTPGAIADFYMERVMPVVEAEGEPTNKPQRHGEPLAFYLRHKPCATSVTLRRAGPDPRRRFGRS